MAEKSGLRKVGLVFNVQRDGENARDAASS
jgi:hypothetical protein